VIVLPFAAVHFTTRRGGHRLHQLSQIGPLCATHETTVAGVRGRCSDGETRDDDDINCAVILWDSLGIPGSTLLLGWIGEWPISRELVSANGLGSSGSSSDLGGPATVIFW